MNADYGSYSQCACGTRGHTVLVSPPILDGGSSKDSVYEIENQGGATHLVRYRWNDEEGRTETICLRTENR